MDYLIRRDTSELDSTGYVEVGPGRYARKHWQPGFLFVWEDAFGMAEGIVARHLPEYDHFAMNDVPRGAGLRITTDWRQAADLLPGLSAAEVHDVLNLGAAYRDRLDAEVEAHRAEIAVMLRELAAECERFYAAGDWVCILGI